MNFDDLSLFAAVVRHRGINAAATACDLQRSKVSRRLQHLEQALGYQLLIRTTRHIELTEKGQWLYNQIQAPLETIESATGWMTEQRSRPSGTLRMAIPPVLGMTELFSHIMEQYMLHYPDIQLNIRHEKASVDLRRTNTDLQILPNYVPPQHDDFVQQRLVDLPYRIVASPRYLAAHGHPNSHEQLSEHTFLASGYIRHAYQSKVRDKHYSDDLHLLKRLACQGHGITALPALLVDKAILQGELIELLAEQRLPDLRVSVIYPTKAYLPEKTRTMIRYLHQVFAKGVAYPQLPL
ncbi:LysR family transcriptional regulator [Ferrimonas pelagia]|uniref:LysR family transcriptional regulator n=1 Tax=Ferrimonas pelagia TaxID=1177826 RepID=A0ABP9EZL0_9GAMM